MNKPTVYIDMDGVLCDYMEIAKKYKARTPGNEFPQASYGFFADMKPIPGAIEAYRWMADNFDVCILTRPSVMNPMCYTEKRVWVEKHLGIEACETLIMCTQKWRLIGDYLIDDMPWPKFRGTQIQFGSPEYPNWQEVLDFFQFKKLELEYPDCTFKRFFTKEMGLYEVEFIDVIKEGKTIKRIKVS